MDIRILMKRNELIEKYNLPIVTDAAYKALEEIAEFALSLQAKEMRVLEIKANHTLANNLCPDHRDKQAGKPCLACEIERLQLHALKAE